MSATRNNSSSRPSPPVPPEALQQLRILLNEYDSLRTPPPTPSSADLQMGRLRTALDQTPSDLWWSDLVEAELHVLDLLSGDQLRVRLAAWRRRMHEVIGDRRYALYLSTACDAASAATKDETVRADLDECVLTTYYFYGSYGVAARSRSAVAKDTFRTAFFVLFIEGLVALLLSWHVQPGRSVFGIAPSVLTTLEYLLATSAAAVLGSVVSVQRRLQDPSVDVDPFYRQIQTTADRFGVAFVSPIFGAIFGMLMYALLLSKLLSSSIVHLNADGGPQSPADVAVLLIFGFIAGFAEQLVPDALSRLAAQALGSVTPTEVLKAPPSAPTPQALVTTNGTTAHFNGEAAPPVARLFWGVDTSKPVSASSIDQMTATIRKPAFWGRYLTGFVLESEEIRLLTQQGIRILPIYQRTTAHHTLLFGPASGDQGQTDAAEAVELARRIGIPTNSGVAIYADIEPEYDVSPAWLEAWIGGLHGAGFIAGLYCGSNQPGIIRGIAQMGTVDQTKVIVWSCMPHDNSKTSKADVPAKIGPPSLKSSTSEYVVDAWQYALDFEGDFDFNVCSQRALAAMWLPTVAAPEPAAPAHI